MSTNTTENESTVEPVAEETTEVATDEAGGEFAPDDLENVPADRLAAMVRDKRKAEKSLRGRLRDAEGRLEGLGGTVQAFQRQALQAAAQGVGVVDSALADVEASVPLDSVLGDDGTVDAGKVADALRELRTSRPHYFRAGGASTTDTPAGGEGNRAPAAAWGDVLAG